MKNRWITKLLTMLLGVAILTGTGGTAVPAKAQETVREQGMEYAKLFNIRYLENGVKLLTEGDGQQKLLVPKEAEIPEGYDDVMVIRTPVEHVMYSSTTHVGLMKSLGKPELYDTIAAVCSPVEEWTIPEVIERMESGQIAYIPQDMTNAGNIEDIAEMSPDLVVLTSGEAAIELIPQLDELSIPYVVEYGWEEESDEGYMEWIRFIGALYNEDELASEVFHRNIEKLESLKAELASVPEEEKPVVAYGRVSDGSVWTAGSSSRTAQTIEAAGGINALSDLEGEGSVQISLEEFLDKCRDADVMIFSSMILYTPDKAAMLEDATYGDPLLAEFKAYQNDRVYVLGKDYYVASEAVYEKFEDWAAMLHPELMEGYELKHFVHLPDKAEETAE